MGNDKVDSPGMAYDMDPISRILSLSDFLREFVIRSAIKSLQYPSGSQGLDVGLAVIHYC